MTEWTDLVKKTWEENRKKPGYKFKDALRDAKKVYKKSGGGTKKNQGGCNGMSPAPYPDSQNGQSGAEMDKTMPPASMKGGKKKRKSTRKSRKQKKGGAIDTTSGGTPYFKTNMN
jgi:hypothetical protein